MKPTTRKIIFKVSVSYVIMGDSNQSLNDYFNEFGNYFSILEGNSLVKNIYHIGVEAGYSNPAKFSPSEEYLELISGLPVGKRRYGYGVLILGFVIGKKLIEDGHNSSESYKGGSEVLTQEEIAEFLAEYAACVNKTPIV